MASKMTQMKEVMKEKVAATQAEVKEAIATTKANVKVAASVAAHPFDKCVAPGFRGPFPYPPLLLPFRAFGD